MKIGVRPHDLSFDTTEELIKICQNVGIDGLQLVCLRTYPEIMNNPMKIDHEIKKLKDAEIEIFLLGSYFNMIHPINSSLQKSIDVWNVNRNIARRNGISFIGSETGSVNGDEWTYHPDNHTEQSYQKLENTIHKITTNLETEMYLLEPVYDHVAYNLDIAKRMMLNDKVAITLDLANLLNIDNYKNYLEIFESFLQEFNNRIKLMHFKNVSFASGKKELVQLDKGIIDYQEILSLVNKYHLTEVPVIVEELQGEELINSINYLRKMEEK